MPIAIIASIARSPHSGDRIIGPRRLAAFASHEPIEGVEIRPLATLRKELGRVHRRQFFGDGSRDELVDTDTVLLRATLYFRFDGARQTKRIGTLISYLLILRIASAGVSTSIPNCAGTTPKSRRLNVTTATARPLTAASSTSSSAGSRS